MEEGSHFHGAFVHSMNASCFCVRSMNFDLPRLVQIMSEIDNPDIKLAS